MKKIETKTTGCSFGCPIEATMSVLSGRWKIAILYHLLDRKLRFGELRRMIPKLSQRMLTLQLRELEEDKIIKRTVYPEVPPRVEYELTTFGFTLKPVLDSMTNWGDKYTKQIKKIKDAQGYE